MIRKLLTLTLCSLAFWACDSKAETFVGLHVGSAHIPQRGQNNTNPGAFVIFDGWRVGVYENSYNRTTVYGARVFNLLEGQYGTLDLSIGAASGYKRECNTYKVKTGSVQTVTKHKEGKVTTSTPVFENRESCTGFSRYDITPMGALTYSAPFSVLGATTELSFMPGFGKHSSVGHLSFKWSIK